MDLEMKWLLLNFLKTLICLQRAYNLIESIIHAKGHFLLVNTNLEYNKIIQQMEKNPIKAISISKNNFSGGGAHKVFT